jgi:hypothetical protein
MYIFEYENDLYPTIDDVYKRIDSLFGQSNQRSGYIYVYETDLTFIEFDTEYLEDKESFKGMHIASLYSTFKSRSLEKLSYEQ